MDFTNKVVIEDLNRISSADINWNKLRDNGVLVTGANGLIGSYLVYTLLYLNDKYNLNINVLALCRNKVRAEERFKSILYRDDFKLVVGDVNDKVNIEEPVNYVIHAASQASPKYFVSDPIGTIKANTIGTMNTLDLAREKNATRFLYISTREIYGKPTNDKEFITEEEYGITDTTEVRSCYPESKRMAENICASYMHQYGLDCKVARIAHTYGPDYARGNGRVWGDFINNVIEGKDIVLKSTGEMKLSFSYISDMIEGLMLVLLEGKEFVYNISNPNSVIAIRDLAQMLVDIYPEKNLKVVFDIPNPKQASGYLAHKVAILDSKKVVELGWKPQIGVKEGFRKSIESMEVY